MNDPLWTVTAPRRRPRAVPTARTVATLAPPAGTHADVAAALRAYGVAALGDLSPSRIVAVARAARVPNFRNAPRRRPR